MDSHSNEQSQRAQGHGAPSGQPCRYGMGHEAHGAQTTGIQGAPYVSPQPSPQGYALPYQQYPVSQAPDRIAHGYTPGGYASPGYSSGASQGYVYAPGGVAAYVQPRTSQMPEDDRKKRGVGFWVAIIAALIAIVVAILLALTMCVPSKSARSGDLGQLEGKSASEIQAELDRVVEEGMFNISIASVVELADGASPGELRIENVPNNNYLMRVVITREDTGEQLYETDVIEPNHHIQSDTLDVDLPPGSYDCIATFIALDPETEDEIGEAAAAMKINVLS